jgi:muramoyltetrapeptide carboxypeptidase LdcA involved in peptidoglycan recycling
LFLENSEEQPSAEWLLYWMRNLGAQGILERISGLLFARPGNEAFNSKEEEQTWLSKYTKFDEAILKGLKEFGRMDMPVVTNMDYGHTVPQLILPYGVKAEINPAKKTVSLLESGVV